METKRHPSGPPNDDPGKSFTVCPQCLGTGLVCGHVPEITPGSCCVDYANSLCPKCGGKGRIQENPPSADSRLHRMAVAYFSRCARTFPVMCASDEFTVLPRAEKALDYLDRLDDVSAKTIEEFVSFVAALEAEIHHVKDNGKDEKSLDETSNRTDALLLRVHLKNIIDEFSVRRTWERDPSLYTKIALIGLDHAFHKPSASDDERVERCLSRLYAIRPLLATAVVQIQNPWRKGQSAARTMTSDGLQYLKELWKEIPSGECSRFRRAFEDAGSALNNYEKHLRSLTSSKSLPTSSEEIDSKQILERFFIQRSLEEIERIAEEEWENSLGLLEKMASRIRPGNQWLDIYLDTDVVPDSWPLLEHFTREIASLHHFFAHNVHLPRTSSSSVDVVATPTYLQSIRSSASFSVALTNQPQERDLFYLSSAHARPRPKGNLPWRLAVERHFLAAHETVPGHHFLDSFRRSLPNPIRRQLEFPLFYEGWAYYAEGLLLEEGYVDSATLKLIHLKRTAWRALRCLADLEVNFGIGNRSRLQRRYLQLGFQPREIDQHLGRFQQNPGYQICYTLGRYEILCLRRRLEPRMGLRNFHGELLRRGEIPFHLFEEELRSNPNSSRQNRQ